MTTPDEQAGPIEPERELDDEARNKAHAEAVEAAKHPHHDGILHKLEGMLDRSSETELRTDAER